jgi:hypothetical protein
MSASQIYIILAVAVFVIVAIVTMFVFFVAESNKEEAYTPITILAFGFILTGILHSSNRLFGYNLMGIGVILAIVDMVRKLKANT